MPIPLDNDLPIDNDNTGDRWLWLLRHINGPRVCWRQLQQSAVGNTNKGRFVAKIPSVKLVAEFIQIILHKTVVDATLFSAGLALGQVR